MTIYITNRIGQHKIPQRITQKTKYTDLSYHTGSCMAHLNCLPPRAAGVNDCFLLAHLVVGVGIKQNAKGEMLLRKIDDEMNVQNCGFSAKCAKLRRWRHAHD